MTQIITMKSSQKAVLNQKTQELCSDEMPLAQEIRANLYNALEPYFPAAGLSAPQIGVSRSLFIFSYNRDPKNLAAVINPQIHPVGETMIQGWENCLSIYLAEMWKIAYLPRYETIDVSYRNLEGKQIEERLSGFAAKVFQHEYDHLQGITILDKEDAIIKEFPTKDALIQFMEDVKKEDAKRY